MNPCPCTNYEAQCRPNARRFTSSIGQFWTCPRCGKRWVTHLLAATLPYQYLCWMEA